MRMPKVTTQQIMAVVFSVAIVLVANRYLVKFMTISREREFAERIHAEQKTLCVRLLAAAKRDRSMWTTGYWGANLSDPEREYRDRLAWRAEMVEYHDGLKRKYNRAKWCPWMPVSPDPPPPRPRRAGTQSNHGE